MDATLAEAFRFSGQSELTAWTLREHFEAFGRSRYDAWRSHEPVLAFPRIRDLAEAFPAWQRRSRTKPAVDERTPLIAALVRQFLGATYPERESSLTLLAEFFAIPRACRTRTR